MKLADMRRHRKKLKLLPDLLAGNPLLMLGLDLPFVVVTGVSLKNAAALSIEMFFIHLFTMLAAYFLASKLDVWQRVLITSTVSIFTMILSRELVMFLIPDIENHAGMYLELMAVNGLTIFSASFLSRKAKLSSVVQTSLLNILAFTVVMFGTSFVREYFGSGTLWQVPVAAPIRLSGVTAPFFGFIFFGFLLGLIRFINKKLSGIYILEKIRRESELGSN